MLIPLMCKQCGGKLEVENSQVLESDAAVIVLSKQTFICPHCQTKYLSGEKVKRFIEKPAISVNGVFVDGDLIGSTLVIGNNVTINKDSSSTTPKDD